MPSPSSRWRAARRRSEAPPRLARGRRGCGRSCARGRSRCAPTSWPPHIAPSPTTRFGGRAKPARRVNRPATRNCRRVSRGVPRASTTRTRSPRLDRELAGGRRVDQHPVRIGSQSGHRRARRAALRTTSRKAARPGRTSRGRSPPGPSWSAGRRRSGPSSRARTRPASQRTRRRRAAARRTQTCRGGAPATPGVMRRSEPTTKPASAFLAAS